MAKSKAGHWHRPMGPDDETSKTSEIEGEFLNLDSLQSSIGRHFTYEALRISVLPFE
jgi:hypothetical protein